MKRPSLPALRRELLLVAKGIRRDVAHIDSQRRDKARQSLRQTYRDFKARVLALESSFQTRNGQVPSVGKLEAQMSTQNWRAKRRDLKNVARRAGRTERDAKAKGASA